MCVSHCVVALIIWILVCARVIALEQIYGGKSNIGECGRTYTRCFNRCLQTTCLFEIDINPVEAKWKEFLSFGRSTILFAAMLQGA